GQGPYTSLYDFCLRNSGRDFNRRALEGLIKSGALDGLELNRKTMLRGTDAVLSAASDRQRYYSAGQMDLFGDSEEGNTFTLEPCDEMPDELKLAMEKEATGLYLSGHPMQAYLAYAKAIKAPSVRSILSGAVDDNSRVRVPLLITSVRLRQIKNDGIMANIIGEDTTGSIGITAFNRAVAESKHLITEGNILLVSGRVQEREDRPFEITADKFELIPKSALDILPTQKRVKSGLYLRVESLNSPSMDEVKKQLFLYSGETAVYVVESVGKKLLAPKNLWVTPSYELISELEQILGKENVKLVE
ncbi:MAG: hypothetical protein J6Q56_03840, partial [Clostridia bacterium]|nr:hypothetical protein [Clostridia bacterium]